MTDPVPSPAADVPGSVLARAPYRIGAVTLVARDVASLTRFYSDVVGLGIVSQQADVARLGIGDTALLTLRADPDARKWSPQEAGLFHIAFLLPGRGNLGAWLRHADAAGVTLTGAADHLVSEAVYLSDPEGNGIEIYVDRPSSEWGWVEDGSVVMRNERLDRTGLIRAATSPWAGMPASGCVGHVHLQVGDLDATERFYAGLLGFDVMCRYPGALFLGSGGYHHQLAGNIWNSRGAAVRTEGTTGLAEISLVADGKTLASVRSRTQAASMSPVGDGDTLVLYDPWGTRFRLAPGQ